ncbi:MAG TPA: hypothetical protein VI455_05715 [Terriglobia bacterium]
MPSRFFQKVVSLSKTPADFKRQQPIAASEVRPSSTVEASSHSTVEDGPASTVEDGYWKAEGVPGIFTASRVRSVMRAQDSLTHVEETVYDVLWGPKRKGDQPEEYRTVSMGYAELAVKARVSKRTIQSVVGRLIDKRFIAIVKGADIYHRKAAVYQVRGYAAAMAVQRGEGKIWVLRTGTGVFFAHPHQLSSTVEASSHSTVEDRPSSTVEGASTVTVEARSASTVEGASTVPPNCYIGNKKEAEKRQAPSSSLLNEAFARNGLILDDDAERTLRKRCQAYDSAATDEEIAHFTEAKIAQCKKSRNIANWVGFLLMAVPECFAAPAHDLKQYRTGKLKEAEEFRKRWSEILEDPLSTDEEHQLAKAALEDPV